VWGGRRGRKYFASSESCHAWDGGGIRKGAVTLRQHYSGDIAAKILPSTGSERKFSVSP